MDISGKVVIVTGASSGIGRAIATLFSKKNAKVALVARSKEKLESLAKTLPNSFVVQADMTKPEEITVMVKKVVEHYKRVDILINNAGQGYDASVEHMNLDTFKGLFDLDVVGPIVAMQQVTPLMRKQKEGVIVNIASGTALMYLPNMGAYSSLKRALVGVTLTAREELKKDNIHVSIVFPYITNTNFEENTIKDQLMIQEEEGKYQIPKGDTPEYIAEKILEGIEKNEAEIYAHDWMKKRA